MENNISNTERLVRKSVYVSIALAGFLCLMASASPRPTGQPVGLGGWEEELEHVRMVKGRKVFAALMNIRDPEYDPDAHAGLIYEHIIGDDEQKYIFYKNGDFEFHVEGVEKGTWSYKDGLLKSFLNDKLFREFKVEENGKKITLIPFVLPDPAPNQIDRTNAAIRNLTGLVDRLQKDIDAARAQVAVMKNKADKALAQAKIYQERSDAAHKLADLHRIKADRAFNQAEANKKEADEALAALALEKKVSSDARAQAKTNQIKADAALHLADLQRKKADKALAALAFERKKADKALSQAGAYKKNADEALAEAEANKKKADKALAALALEKKVSSDARAQAAANKKKADEALTQAAADVAQAAADVEEADKALAEFAEKVEAINRNLYESLSPAPDTPVPAAVDKPTAGASANGGLGQNLYSNGFPKGVASSPAAAEDTIKTTNPHPVGTSDHERQNHLLPGSSFSGPTYVDVAGSGRNEINKNDPGKILGVTPADPRDGTRVNLDTIPAQFQPGYLKTKSGLNAQGNYVPEFDPGYPGLQKSYQGSDSPAAKPAGMNTAYNKSTYGDPSFTKPTPSDTYKLDNGGKPTTAYDGNVKTIRFEPSTVKKPSPISPTLSSNANRKERLLSGKSNITPTRPSVSPTRNNYSWWK